MIASLAAVLAVAASPPPTADTSAFPACGAVIEQPCRVPDAISADDARRWLGGQSFAWRIDADTFKAVGTGAQAPQLCCTFQGVLDPVRGAPNLWALSLRAPRLNEAVVDVISMSPTGGQPAVWRGPDAPPPSTRLTPPADWVHEITLESKALGEKRRVVVYTPPAQGAARPVIFVADGGQVWELAAIAHGLAQAGLAREPILVGLEVGPADAPAPGQPGFDPQRSNLLRNQEYLLAFKGGEDRFASHERFLLDEVLPYVEKTWGAKADPRLRAVMGQSNGAAWALAMAARHPETFQTAIALSFTWGQPALLAALKEGQIRNAYLGAGLYEENPLRRTRDAATELSGKAERLRLEIRAAGHSPTAWDDQFAQALVWAFPAEAKPTASSKPS